jgi:hypothetical protein
LMVRSFAEPKSLRAICANKKGLSPLGAARV